MEHSAESDPAANMRCGVSVTVPEAGLDSAHLRLHPSSSTGHRRAQKPPDPPTVHPGTDDPLPPGGKSSSRGGMISVPSSKRAVALFGRERTRSPRCLSRLRLAQEPTRQRKVLM